MNPHTPKWAPTLGVGLPMDFQWTLEFLEGNFKGQNSLDYKVLYIIGKLLELKCLKWAFMTHLRTLSISYGQKKGRESNCQFDF
jgi:hypothetical protein